MRTSSVEMSLTKPVLEPALLAVSDQHMEYRSSDCRARLTILPCLFEAAMLAVWGAQQSAIDGDVLSLVGLIAVAKSIRRQ